MSGSWHGDVDVDVDDDDVYYLEDFPTRSFLRVRSRRKFMILFMQPVVCLSYLM